jgi:hypothetical protein
VSTIRKFSLAYGCMATNNVAFKLGIWDLVRKYCEIMFKVRVYKYGDDAKL